MDNQASYRPERDMKVYGMGKVFVEPDVAEVRLGVVTQHLEAQLAQQDNATTVRRVIQSLEEIGIPKENIQTVDYSIFPQYDYSNNIQKFKGYQVANMLAVTTSLNLVGIVIDTAIRFGVNRVLNISFSVKNKEAYYLHALELAVHDAYKKAGVIAQLMRVALYPVPVSIIEQSPLQPPTPYKMVSSSELVGGVATPIEPGRIEIDAKVETNFSFFIISSLSLHATRFLPLRLIKQCIRFCKKGFF